MWPWRSILRRDSRFPGVDVDAHAPVVLHRSHEQDRGLSLGRGPPFLGRRGWPAPLLRRTIPGTVRVFSYVLRIDGGFAPNPYYGWCTLACCKPRVRASAAVGDLIVGLSRRCERIVYAMLVEHRITFDEYWRDPEFRAKRPNWTSRDVVERVGDNIYEPDGEGGFVQHRSMHRKGPEDDLPNRRRDLSCEWVLAGREFSYFGGEGPLLPESIGFLRVTRAHRCRFASAEVRAVARHLEMLPKGVHGVPGQWSLPRRPEVNAE